MDSGIPKKSILQPSLRVLCHTIRQYRIIVALLSILLTRNTIVKGHCVSKLHASKNCSKIPGLTPSVDKMNAMYV